MLHNGTSLIEIHPMCIGFTFIPVLSRCTYFLLGKANILWPGLNAPLMKGREVYKRRQLPPNPEYQAQLVKIRDELSKVRYPKLAPLERGWSGNRFPGQTIGPPEPFGDCELILYWSKFIGI